MKSMPGINAPILVLCLFVAGCYKKELIPLDQDKLQSAITDKAANHPKNLNNWTINTVAGSSIYGYAGDGGPAANAILNNPANVNLDQRGNIYISDLNNNVIRKIDARTGIISTVAGNGIFGYSGDGGPATQASLGVAFHTIVDDEGNLIISDLANNRIRRVDRSTGIINTIAGTGNLGYNGDGHTALATDLNIPMGIAFDNRGNLLFSDQGGLRIRKMDMRTKIITTVVGNGDRGYSGDGGPATRASLNFVWNLAVDCDGDIYFGDEENYRVRKVDGRTGIISTFAGNGMPGNSGIGGLAKNASFLHPVGITFDDKGNVFISDETLSQIYVIDKRSGILNLIAGNGTNGFSGDGGPAQQALLFLPNSLSSDKDGNIYISDSENNRIRKLTRKSN